MQVQETHVQTERILTVPNVLSGLRLLGVPVFLWLILGPEADGWAVALLMVSGFTDYLDGYLARRWHQISRLGQLLDPIADRLYILATLIGLGIRDIIPWWLVIFLLLRDVMLLATGPSAFLFPARQGGAKPPGQLAGQIQRAVRQEIGLQLNVHLFRHLAAKLFLTAHPGEYETVRLLLGHKSLVTTVRIYCGLEQSDAMRRYDAVLDRYRADGKMRDAA